ncbi:MAG: DUF4229 domain-containing protein [Microbacteriaceae bacterium]|nr:DUF4229 domain-containing protein [Microbacteriaceae bacterium]
MSDQGKQGSTKRAWLQYTVLRLLFFAVPLTIILLILPPESRFGINWFVLFAVLASAVISLALSIIFLSGLREKAALAVEEWRSNSHTDDDTAEDAALDGEN